MPSGHTGETATGAEVENLRAGLEAYEAADSHGVKHMVLIQIIDILARDNVNLLIPFMIQRIQGFKLRILLVGELWEILFNQIHGAKIQIILNYSLGLTAFS